MKFSSLSWGVVLYAIMYLVWAGLVLYGFAGGIGARIFSLVVLIALSAYAGRSLRMNGWRDVFPYSIVWMLTIIVLDAVFTVPYSGWGLYADPNVWVGYLLVLFVPIVAISARLPSRSIPA